ncbi:TetR/AcrR family transcriptional regulator [[Clostridium] fimetarium]|uniref:DNA-binding transcriptional regulator, AcrR family n=1 Tax=[Clostridium] fimetarium TaxID=99656 RepID=A0A1I0RKX8_9FIRM|nr:TetR/AcrR family transcriptional regulator [[Clostridium] fimetarium]SEW41755.1 DNA-binding transcriptional regulator, AcrR family [[Clostridium] fimetarium]
MDTKAEILSATFQLFAEKGYNTTMADIAKKVGIKVPSIYSHFQSKDEIICLVMTQEIRSFFDNLNAQISIVDKDEHNSETKLKSFCFFIFTYFTKPERIRFWKSISLIYNYELRENCRQLVKENETQIAILLKNIFTEGKRKGEIKYESLEGSLFLFIAMIHGVLDAILVYNETEYLISDLDNYKKKIWQAYWDGIKG